MMLVSGFNTITILTGADSICTAIFKYGDPTSNAITVFPAGFFQTMAGVRYAKRNVRDLLCNYERCNNIFHSL